MEVVLHVFRPWATVQQRWLLYQTYMWKPDQQKIHILFSSDKLKNLYTNKRCSVRWDLLVRQQINVDQYDVVLCSRIRDKHFRISDLVSWPICGRNTSTAAKSLKIHSNSQSNINIQGLKTVIAMQVESKDHVWINAGLLKDEQGSSLGRKPWCAILMLNQQQKWHANLWHIIRLNGKDVPNVSRSKKQKI